MNRAYMVIPTGMWTRSLSHTICWCYYYTAHVKWSIGVLYHVALMFDKLLQISPAKRCDSKSLVPGSRLTSKAADRCCWWFSTRTKQLYHVSMTSHGELDIDTGWRIVWKIKYIRLLLTTIYVYYVPRSSGSLWTEPYIPLVKLARIMSTE